MFILFITKSPVKFIVLKSSEYADINLPRKSEH